MFTVGGGNYVEYQNLLDYAKVCLVPNLYHKKKDKQQLMKPGGFGQRDDHCKNSEVTLTISGVPAVVVYRQFVHKWCLLTKGKCTITTQLDSLKQTIFKRIAKFVFWSSWPIASAKFRRFVFFTYRGARYSADNNGVDDLFFLFFTRALSPLPQFSPIFILCLVLILVVSENATSQDDHLWHYWDAHSSWVPPTVVHD